MDNIKVLKTKEKKLKTSAVMNGALSKQSINSDWYKTVIQSSPDGFLLIRHPDGDIIDVNDAFCNMLGYRRDEMLSMNISDIEVGLDKSLDSIKERITNIEETGEASFETRHRRKRACWN